MRAYDHALSWAAGRLDETGISLLIEPVNAVDNPGYFLTDFGVAERIIGALGLPNLRLQFDTYHLRMNGGDVAASFTHLLPLIGHIQVSSVPGRGEPDADDIAFLSSLDSLGYAGAVGCEYIPRAGTLAGLGWRERL
jgi:hydroxypyruvate isomerase